MVLGRVCKKDLNTALGFFSRGEHGFYHAIVTEGNYDLEKLTGDFGKSCK